MYKEIELSYEKERPDRAFDRKRALKFYNESQDETKLWLRQLEPDTSCKASISAKEQKYEQEKTGNAFFTKKEDSLDLSSLAEFI